MTSELISEPAGHRFGPYILTAVLGRGGMGVVYRAFDTTKGRTVALKVLIPELAADRAFQDKFRRESKHAARLMEPHIIPIHDYGQIDGRLFIDMRLVEGIDLATLLNRDGPLQPPAASWITAQVASALDAAHADRLIHRDVKPSNVLITGHTQSMPFAYLIDFGIARTLSGASRATIGDTIGTAAYVAPERIQGSPGERCADVYSLACVLYECLTGQAPFGGEMVHVMWAHVNALPPPPSTLRPGLPAAVDGVLARGLAKDPARRYGTAGELAEAILAATADLGAQGFPVPVPHEPPTRQQPPSAKDPVPVDQSGPVRADPDLPLWDGDPGGHARAVLRAIVSDPDRGRATLSNARAMSAALRDLMPRMPRETKVLVAAAEMGLSEALSYHVARGLDPALVREKVARSFARHTGFRPAACQWVVDELAAVLGLDSASARPSWLAAPDPARAGLVPQSGPCRVRSQLLMTPAGRDPAQGAGAEGATSPEPLRHTNQPGQASLEWRSAGHWGATPWHPPGGQGPRQTGSQRPCSPGRLSMTDFAARHIGPDEGAQQRMLASLGYSALEELTRAALPGDADPARLTLPDPLTETQALAELRRMADRNQVLTSMIGLGYYDTVTPAVIRRNVLENPAWYTAYTPYQPEISQGRLEALLNFQTVIADLTALPWAGASLLDEATAAAEAMTLARRAKGKGRVFLADADCLPQTLAVLRTRAEPLGIHLVVEPVTAEAIARQDGLFGVLLQFPGASGVIRDLTPLIEAAHARGALAAVAADLLALTLLKPPGEMGADIAVGSSQRFGVPLWFGGPHAGYIAVSDPLKRQLPGRLVGVSVDADGRPAYRLALQAREQHIRREKATSNICTAQVLLAVTAAMYAAYHGPDGLAAIARGAHRSAAVLAATLRDFGHRTDRGDFFDTIRIVFRGGRDEAVRALDRAREAGYNLYLAPDGALQASCDETTTDEQLREVVAAICQVERAADVALSQAEPDVLPVSLRRGSAFLTHPVFSAYRSETAMLRYLRRLADFDIALDRSMIPLGSCTMKLNAAAEMEPISWPEFAGMHPFAPAPQAGGYLELIDSLEVRLARLTGYDAVSVQPNAGSQGELAGLLAIRAYHASRGEQHRDICLIPESAHGTNAASAVLAGLRVTVVKCGSDGAIDDGDLHAKLAAHHGDVAAIMLTYPSTAGVYEQNVSAVCAAVHEAGGQVYIDGANLNALVGVATLPSFGADVSHLNLHKTFCIPHGGGGPGVGPVAVRAHLAEFLPGRGEVGPVAAAPYGSAGILPISWAYVAMMGADGLRRATQVAVLSANYVARRLAPHYPVLYTGRNGLVAHECVIDLRALTRDTGVTVDDVAKRLIDYGFHAPTMSFPVSGTLMIEPTESESLHELDRFCDAMISIRTEIGQVADGEYDLHDNPLKNAPHTAEMLIAGEWKHPYQQEEAAYPAGVDRRAKYWPPVRRIDQAYGDRNLICACPPPEAFAS